MFGLRNGNFSRLRRLARPKVSKQEHADCERRSISYCSSEKQMRFSLTLARSNRLFAFLDVARRLSAAADADARETQANLAGYLRAKQAGELTASLLSELVVPA